MVKLILSIEEKMSFSMTQHPVNSEVPTCPTLKVGFLPPSAWSQFWHFNN